VVLALEGALLESEYDSPQLILASQDSRANAWAASDGRRHRNKPLWYPRETGLLLSKGKARRWEFKATKLEAAIKSIVREVTGDSESPLLERNESAGCRT